MWSLLLSSVFAFAAPQVEVVSFQGEPRVGEWRGLADGRITITQAGKEESVPLSEVLEVRFRGEAARLDKPAVVVTMADGSTLSGSQALVVEKRLKLNSTLLGDLSWPQSDVASIRFADRFSSVDEQWAKLTERELKSDLLVIRKENTLDYLDGVVVEVTDKSVKFLLDGEEVSTKREKVFGLLFARRPSSSKPPPVRIEFTNGDVLQATALSNTGEQLSARLTSKADVPLPLERLKVIDLGQGKLKYLSQLEPREVKYTPGLIDLEPYRRDSNMDGGSLRLGNRVFLRGLCVRSKTLLRYRLGGEYRRFQALTGIDHLVASNGNGDCRLVISGDGKVLFEADVRAKDAPRPIDLNVSEVVNLEVLVDFGGNLDLSDHLDLADAKLVK